jgi:hypothetical protein
MTRESAATRRMAQSSAALVLPAANRSRSVTTTRMPLSRCPEYFLSVATCGVKSLRSNRTPGRLRAFSSDTALSARSHGAPSRWKASGVPRPTLTLVASNGAIAG